VHRIAEGAIIASGDYFYNVFLVSRFADKFDGFDLFEQHGIVSARPCRATRGLGSGDSLFWMIKGSGDASATSSWGSRSVSHAQSGFQPDNGGRLHGVAPPGAASPQHAQPRRVPGTPTVRITFSQVIDELDRGNGIDGGVAVKLLHWFFISRFVLVRLGLIPGNIIAIQRVGSVMIADPVQDASAMAVGMVANEGKLELYSTA
jgi:hypothetical protein